MNFEDSRAENICCHQQMVTGITVSPHTSKPSNSVNTGSAVTIWWSDGGNTLSVTARGQILRGSELLRYAVKAGCWKSKICEVQVGGVWSKYCFPFSLLFICFLWHQLTSVQFFLRRLCANALTPVETEILIRNKIFAVWPCHVKWQKIEHVFFQKIEYTFRHKTLYTKCIIMKFHSENKTFRKSKVFNSFQRDSRGLFLLKSHIMKNRTIVFCLNETFWLMWNKYLLKILHCGTHFYFVAFVSYLKESKFSKWAFSKQRNVSVCLLYRNPYSTWAKSAFPKGKCLSAIYSGFAVFTLLIHFSVIYDILKFR